uniref:Uncharacterized protein n=1 Tax=Candidatus Kentrum sp. FM TaxID=2126340 RepID=A0A450WUU1_9GAMM|nr:MAG: hypothetical protein BECKFM1743B_GA0114221_100221 [Candidatus Kentron sp. FM]VFK20782.1 MAG: hypothetical protein BECKFM1743B_GA0114221_107283 [Candidatus Kentron sp. FM]
MKKRSLYGINEHFEDIFNAVRECKMTFAYSSKLRGILFSFEAQSGIFFSGNHLI